MYEEKVKEVECHITRNNVTMNKILVGSFGLKEKEREEKKNSQNDSLICIYLVLEITPFSLFERLVKLLSLV